MTWRHLAVLMPLWLAIFGFLLVLFIAERKS